MNYYRHNTYKFENVYIKNGFTVAGPKECAGKLKGYFDVSLDDDMCGEQTFEKAERRMFETAIEGVENKCNMLDSDIDAVLGGDLLNQIVSTSFAMRKHNVGFLGLYNACATFAESLIVGSSFVSTGMQNVICVAGSHFSTAERQYRYPLELGVFRSPVTQWTATGVGATLLTSVACNCPRINRCTVGKVVDYGIKDVNNMGAAMAPASYETLRTFLDNTGALVSDYDLIVTGDLGKLGKDILIDLAMQDGIDLSMNLADAGASLFYDEQQTYQGGSGAACSALAFNSILLQNLFAGNMHKLLLIGTGALMSPLTSFQGESIPAIAHLVEVEM